jgi:hypothetical protein
MSLSKSSLPHCGQLAGSPRFDETKVSNECEQFRHVYS